MYLSFGEPLFSTSHFPLPGGVYPILDVTGDVLFGGLKRVAEMVSMMIDGMSSPTGNSYHRSVRTSLSRK
jgi:hypothetical protein